MRRIKLTQNKFAIIDDADFEKVSAKKWFCERQESKNVTLFYASARFGKTHCYLHRFILGAKKGEVVDHINHDSLDCRRSNLRIVTQHQNLMNQRGTKGGASKFKGVSTCKSSKRPWRAGISFHRESIYLGVFKTQKEAALAYNARAKELYGEYAALNKI